MNLQHEIDNLDEEKDKRQRQMWARKDEIKKRAAELHAEAVRQLNGSEMLENIMTFSFEIT